MMHQRFVVVVPVKAPAIGKSRLRVPDHVRPDLARAFALDVLDTVLQVEAVVEVAVVTSDASFARSCARRGVRTLPDGDGLNDALSGAVAALRRDHVEAMPVALCADLPCLRPGELAQALASVGPRDPWFCADAAGTGTTMYAAPYDAFDPQFGVGSRAAHERAGARSVPGELPGLRRDVDDESDLAAAVRLGTGPETRAVLAAMVP